MTDFSAFLNFDAGTVGAGLTVTLITFVVGSSARWAFRKVLSVNRKWTLRWNERELAQQLRLQGEPAAITEFLVGKALWALMLLGIGMMFLPLGDTEQGRRMLLVIGWLLGTCIYVVTLNGLATVHHLRRAPEKTIERLRARVAALKAQ